MAWLESLRVARVASVVALLWMGVACGEEKKITDDDDDNGDEVTPPEGETEEDAGAPTDVRNPPFDAGIPPVQPGPVNQDGAVVIPDTGMPLTPLEDGGTPALPTTPLPYDGAKLSICYADSDCLVNDLKCFLPATSSGPGVCVDDCETDKECPELDGVAGACSPLLSPNACEYDCSGAQNDGTGMCPKDMVCGNFSLPTLPLLPIWRCRYPAEGGKKTESLWARCDRAHNAGDCQGENSCFRPAANLSTVFLPHGYCSNDCAMDAECVAPAGKTAVPACMAGFGKCVLKCDNPGATCPDGMNCVDVDPLQFTSTMICVYID